MGSFYYSIEKKGTEVKIICDKSCKINSRELDVINSNGLNSILQPVVIDTGKKLKFSYDTSAYYSLYEYVQMVIPRNTFVRICMDFMNTVQNINQRYMKVENLLLDFQFIYVHRQTGELKYIYIPVIRDNKNINVVGFLSEFPFKCIFDRNESREYVKCYINYFNSLVNFSWFDYKKMLDSILAMNLTRSNAATYDGSINKGYGNVNIQNGYSANGLYQPGMPYASQKQDVSPNGGGETRMLNIFNQQNASGQDNEKTVLLVPGSADDNAMPEQKPAYIMSLSEDKKSRITNPNFTIGKADDSDYKINDKHVSRHHAAILYMNDYYFIKDCNSTNHTYLNGQMVPVKVKVKLNNNDIITLGDYKIKYIEEQE